MRWEGQRQVEGREWEGRWVGLQLGRNAHSRAGWPLTFSCTLTSWNLVNFDPLVCRHSRPPDLFFWHSLLGHITRGMNVGEAIWGGARGRGQREGPPISGVNTSTTTTH